MNDDTNDDTNDDQRLQELLDMTAPDSPDLSASARVDAVTGRARSTRRRTTWVLAAVVLAVVGVGIGVPVLTAGDDGPSARDDAADTTPEVVEPPACPATPIDVSEGLGVDDLPDGAVSARLCPGRFGPPEGQLEFTLPTEPVTDGVDSLLRLIRNLPGGPLPDQCAAIMVAPMPWALVVSYPDGSERTLGTTATACSQVEVAGETLQAEDVLTTVQSALGEPDPAGEVDPDQGAVALCPDPGAESGTLVAEPDTYDGPLADLGATSAIVCYSARQQTDPAYAETRGFLEGAELDTVVSDLVDNATAEAQLAGRCPDEGFDLLLVLSGPDGQVTLTDNSCTAEFRSQDGFWVPGAESRDAITTALGGETTG